MDRYDAFISYSHKKDKVVAKAIQSVVQELGKEWWRRRALRVFLDDSSLAATPALWPSITSCLDRTRFLILLASPEAARSHWVDKEVDYWLQNKGAGTLLVALTGGNLQWDMAAQDFSRVGEAALPPSLKGRFQSEPKWIDFRSYRQGGERASKSNPDFLQRAADLAAAIRGVAKEDLLSDELLQQRRALTLAWSAAAGLSALAVVSGWQTWQAKRERARVELVLADGTRTANNLVTDLSQRFSGQKGIPQQFIIDVLGEARGLVSQLAKSGGERPELMEAQATALLELSSAMRSQGKLDAALEDGLAAARIFEGLVAASNPNPDVEVGVAAAKDRVGDALFALGRHPEARAAYEDGSRLSRNQAGRGIPGALHNLAVSLEKIGRVELAARRIDDAKRAFEDSITLRSKLADDAPERADLSRALAVAHGNIAAAYLAAGTPNAALVEERKRLAIAERLASQQPENYDLQRDLGSAFRGLAAAQAALRDIPAAEQSLHRDLAIVTAIAGSDPARIDWQRDVIAASDRLGDLLLAAGKPNDALPHFQRSLSVALRVAQLEPQRTDLADALALAHHKLGKGLVALGRTDEAVAAYRESIAIRSAPTNGQARPESWDATLETDYQALSEAYLAAGRFAEALMHAEQRAERFAVETQGTSEATVRALEGVGWYALFAGAYDRALDVWTTLQKMGKAGSTGELNAAHALMLSGRTSEARAVYSARKPNEAVSGRKWAELVLADFDALRKAGIASPMMAEVEAHLASTAGAIPERAGSNVDSSAPDQRVQTTP